MIKQTVTFAVITNKDGVVIQIGRSVILQPQVITKSSLAAAQRKEVSEKESM